MNSLRLSFRNCGTLALVLLVVACGAPKRLPPRVESRPEVIPSPKPTTRASVAYDKFQGSCVNLQNYIQSRGVQDCDGQMHPGWFGATRCQVVSSGFTFTPRVEQGMVGRECVSVEFPRGQMPFKLQSACVRIVEWLPHSSVAQSCAAERQRWLTQAYDHEQHHVTECELAVNEGNRRWAASPHRFKACAFTEAGARRELNREIEAALGAEHRRIMNAINDQSESFHNSAAGQAIVTRCSQCSQ